MNDAQDPGAGGKIIVESSRAVARAATDSRGLSRPPIPKTTKLSDPRELIAVDLDEGMDEAAAVEAADPRSDNLSLKAIRSLIVGCTLAVAWWLLPHESPPRPPIELPEALQSEISVSPEQAAVEATASAIFTKDGPEAAIPALEKCVTPGPATHRAWRTFLTALQQRDHDEELLTKARAYAEKYPDRLEAAHFVAEALLRQDMDDHREGILGSVSSTFKKDLESAQQQLSQSLDLLDDHKSDWSSTARRAWHDALLVDSARLYLKRWRCEGSPFEHDLRDQAIASLERMHQKDARNAMELKRDIYVGIMQEWGYFQKPKTHINGKDYDYQSLVKFIGVMEDNLKKSTDGE